MVVSGSGNVAIYAVEKATQLGAKVVAMSDSNGYIVDENGIDLPLIKQLKEVERKRVKDYLNDHPDAKFFENGSDIWSVPCDIALPSATQNELDEEAAHKLVANGCIAVADGAKCPAPLKPLKVFQDIRRIVWTGQGRQCWRGSLLSLGDVYRTACAIPGL